MFAMRCQPLHLHVLVLWRHLLPRELLSLSGYELLPRRALLFFGLFLLRQ
jgi:hypothetical protein